MCVCVCVCVCVRVRVCVCLWVFKEEQCLDVGRLEHNSVCACVCVCQGGLVLSKSGSETFCH